MGSHAGFDIAPSTATVPGRVLDIGCGLRKIPGSVGVDALKTSAADVICDLNRRPWPFADDAFDGALCRHALGHLENVVGTLEEIHRIVCPGGIVEIIAPHFSSDNFFTDITSKHSFGYRSMDYFAENRNSLYRYSSKARFRLLDAHISFNQSKAFPGDRRKANPLRWMGLEWLVNRFPRHYEHFLAFILRANEVYFRLEVVKD